MMGKSKIMVFRNQCWNYANNENHRKPLNNNENNENLRNPLDNTANH